MELVDYLTADRVMVGASAGDRQQAIGVVAEFAASRLDGLSRKNIVESLAEREQLFGGMLGQGTALLDARVAGIDKIAAFMVLFKKSVNFSALDGIPVDICFLLLAPLNAGGEHLRVQAWISRMLRNSAACERLRGCRDPEAAYIVATQAHTDRAA